MIIVKKDYVNLKDDFKKVAVYEPAVKFCEMFGQLQILICSMCTMVVSGRTTNIPAVTVFLFSSFSDVNAVSVKSYINDVHHHTPRFLCIKT